MSQPLRLYVARREDTPLAHGDDAFGIRLREACGGRRDLAPVDCPVILSDDWLAPGGVDWAQCAVRVPERDVGALPARLERIGMERARDMGQAARREWERHFAADARFARYLASLSELHGSRPSCYTAAALRARWASRRFLRGNRWTLAQRAADRCRLALRGAPLN